MKHPVIYAFSAGVAVGSVGTATYITYRILLNDTMYTALKDATTVKVEKIFFGEPSDKRSYQQRPRVTPDQSSGRL